MVAILFWLASNVVALDEISTWLEVRGISQHLFTHWSSSSTTENLRATLSPIDDLAGQDNNDKLTRRASNSACWACATQREKISWTLAWQKHRRVEVSHLRRAKAAAENYWLFAHSNKARLITCIAEEAAYYVNIGPNLIGALFWVQIETSDWLNMTS